MATEPSDPRPATGVRDQILSMLHALPVSGEDPVRVRAVGLSAPELAERLGLHVTTVRFHLDQLLASGDIATGEPMTAERRRGRPPRTYAALTAPIIGARDDQAFRMLAELLADGCGAREGITPEQAGRRWAARHTRDQLPSRVPDVPSAAGTTGEWIGKVGQVVEFLQSWGYDPTVRIVEGGRSADLALDHCPFQAMARTREEVVCGVHRGLVRGALEVLGEEGTRVGLEPFVTPTSCRVRLTAADAGVAGR